MIHAAVLACATCISSPYGDRAYSWPYLLLIVLPFVVATVIGIVLARVNGVSAPALLRRLGHALHPAARTQEETP